MSMSISIYISIYNTSWATHLESCFVLDCGTLRPVCQQAATSFSYPQVFSERSMDSMSDFAG